MKNLVEFEEKLCLLRHPFRQSSSVVEQGTHKPLVGSSILPSGTNFQRVA